MPNKHIYVGCLPPLPDWDIEDGTRHVVPGILVGIVLKKDQKTGILTFGIVRDVLTRKKYHTRGRKVRLLDGQIGRVQYIFTRKN